MILTRADGTTKDPIGFKGGDADLYGYCLSDPVNGVDLRRLLAMFGGFGVRATLPSAGGEAGIAGVLGTEGIGITAQLSAYLEAFVAGGLSFGRGPFIGFWSGDVSEISCATEIGIDTPYVSLSILFDMNRINIGITIG